jgi:hypothetical protein
MTTEKTTQSRQSGAAETSVFAGYSESADQGADLTNLLGNRCKLPITAKIHALTFSA